MDNTYPLLSQLIEQGLEDDKFYICYISETFRQSDSKFFGWGKDLKELFTGFSKIGKDMENRLIWGDAK